MNVLLLLYSVHPLSNTNLIAIMFTLCFVNGVVFVLIIMHVVLCCYWK